jgi:hypothetical protein
MSQKLRPSSDYAKSGLTIVSGSYAYAVVDEETADYGDYFYRPSGSGYVGSGYATLEMTDPASTPLNPAVAGDLRINYQVNLYRVSDGATAYGKIDIALYQGASLVESFTLTGSSSFYGRQSGSLDISTANFSGITDWGALRLKVTCYCVSKSQKIGDQTYYAYAGAACEWIELEVPDAAVACGIEMGMMF